MAKATTSYLDKELKEILYSAAYKPQPLGVQEAHAGTIERMLHQCHSLLRQQLERQIKRDPGSYSKARMEQVLGRFEAAIPDIRDAVAGRVEDGISELIRQEIRSILLDALTELQEAMLEPVSKEAGRRAGAHCGSGGPGQPGKLRPISEPSRGPGGPGLATAQPGGHKPPAPLPSSATDYQQGQDGHGDGSGRAKGVERQAADDDVYQGNVKVNVETHGTVKDITHFMSQLAVNPRLSVSRMMGGRGGVTVWLLLRQPLCVKEVLSQMEGVAEVSARSGDGSEPSEPTFEVVLEGAPSLPGRLAGEPAWHNLNSLPLG